MRISGGAFYLLIALSSLVAGLYLASVHPVAPFAVAAAYLGIVALFLRYPKLALLSLPIFLPILNFSPWTGWLIVDEFDMLLLAVLATGYFSLWRDKLQQEARMSIWLSLVIVGFLVVTGVNALSVKDIDFFSGAMSPLNSFRVGKSVLWAMLLYPLVAQAGKENAPYQATKAFLSACLLGSVSVVLAVFWERAFYPGLLDVSASYRTVALFWEMHLGGAALDAYLVLIAPLLVWGWRASSSIPKRLVLGVFILAFVYACLTTFSRGVIGAIFGSLLLLALLQAFRRARFMGERSTPTIRVSSVIILFMVFLEVAIVLASGSFLNKRLAASERDLSARWQHWERGIGILKTPQEWLFGVGLGNFSSRLMKSDSGIMYPGSFHFEPTDGRHGMLISGPGGIVPNSLFALSQRIDLIPGQHYRFSMDVQSGQSADLLVKVCAMHLLYPEKCQYRMFRVNAAGWQHHESWLTGVSLKNKSWLGSGHGVLLLSVVTPGAAVELSNLSLLAGRGELLRNAGFKGGASGWFPIAHSYFLPWHIDNLYLELLIELGISGLVAFLVIVLLTIQRLFKAYAQGHTLAPYLISCITGLMTLGLVVSVFDMPRAAMLFLMLLLCAWQTATDSDDVHLRSKKQN